MGEYHFAKNAFSNPVHTFNFILVVEARPIGSRRWIMSKIVTVVFIIFAFPCLPTGLESRHESLASELNSP